MVVNPYILVLFGVLFAAAGQILFKLGANGAEGLLAYINTRIVAGLVLYGASTALWIVALSKLPLTRVYPFTVLTFVLVYAASVFVLGERVSGTVLLGASLVLAGLVVITMW